MKTFLYFQPEYVSKFKCDGSKCNARCCKGWRIDIDAATYKKYSRIKPKSKAKEITSRMKFDSELGVYVVELAKAREDILWQRNISTSNPNMLTSSGAPGGICLNNCCERSWLIDVDTATYKKYSRIKPKNEAKKITSHFEYDDAKDCYMLKERPCPFLTEDKLCGIQLNYGENFLSQTCATYPRRTAPFGKFFERSLTLTCPVAAEMILFAQEPMKFEFVKVPEKVHSNHGKIKVGSHFPASEKAAEQMLAVQVAIISILQERTLSINQRLIVLCFFVDKLEEIIYSRGLDEDELKKLIAAYESKEFLTEQVPLMIQTVNFGVEKFIRLMMEMFEAFYSTKEIQLNEKGHIFLNTVINTLQIKPDENNFVSLSKITANYEQLAEARKKFFADYSTFLENYLVNELFLNLYPWKHNPRPSRSLSVFLITYKVFELLTFAATQNNLSSKDSLLQLVDWYTDQIDHGERLLEKIFTYLEERDDFFELMETLLDK